jgi:hypothetical protein
MIESAILIAVLWAIWKYNDYKVTRYMNTHHIDYGKMNDDRRMNDLSKEESNRRMLNGEYLDWRKYGNNNKH